MMDMLVDARGDGGSGINAAWFLIFDAAIQSWSHDVAFWCRDWFVFHAEVFSM